MANPTITIHVDTTELDKAERRLQSYTDRIREAFNQHTYPAPGGGYFPAIPVGPLAPYAELSAWYGNPPWSEAIKPQPTEPAQVETVDWLGMKYSHEAHAIPGAERHQAEAVGLEIHRAAETCVRKAMAAGVRRVGIRMEIVDLDREEKGGPYQQYKRSEPYKHIAYDPAKGSDYTVVSVVKPRAQGKTEAMRQRIDWMRSKAGTVDVYTAQVAAPPFCGSGGDPSPNARPTGNQILDLACGDVIVEADGRSWTVTGAVGGGPDRREWTIESRGRLARINVMDLLSWPGIFIRNREAVAWANPAPKAPVCRCDSFSLTWHGHEAGCPERRK